MLLCLCLFLLLGSLQLGFFLLFFFLLAFVIAVEDLVADLLQDISRQVVHKLVPPVVVARKTASPVRNFEADKVARKVQRCHGDHLRLPFQTQVRHVRVVDEGPGHLRDSVDFSFLP